MAHDSLWNFIRIAAAFADWRAEIHQSDLPILSSKGREVDPRLVLVVKEYGLWFILLKMISDYPVRHPLAPSCC